MNSRSASTSPLVHRINVLLVCALLALPFGMATPAAAFQFSLGDEIRGNLDTTLSYGAAWRMKKQDSRLIGTANGGSAYSVNYDDGNLNYNRGDLISHSVKATSELALNWRNFGLFVRGTAFYDFENNDGSRRRTDLSSGAKSMVGKDATLLDAYINWDFDIATAPAQLRLGQQVLSWGESTFIQNGINIINPVDVTKLRVAGAELREALVPVGMISGSISPTENISFEAFYQYQWKETKIDPTGSYWSTNDFAGRSGDRVLLGWGRWSDQGESWQGLVIPDPVIDDRFNMVPRGKTVYASDDGQYGVAMRLFAPGLNDTEFGFYFINYHSRLPALSARTGTAEGRNKFETAATAAGTFAFLVESGTPAPDAIAPAITAGTTAGIVAGLDPTEAQQIATGAINAATAGGAELASAYALNQYAQTAQYIVEYPEDIKLFGVSFNTLINATGTALQGEYSYRKDVPLQMDDIELLLAALTPLQSVNASLPFANNQLGVYDVDTNIRGYKRKDVSQIQMTATQLFGPTLGASQFVLVGEVGLTHVHGMPSKSKLRFDGPGTPVSGNPEQAEPGRAHAGKDAEPASAFADATSWGYRMVARLDYNNAIGAVTLSPRIGWSHDVKGTTPGPGGNFVEGRKAITLGLSANYQNRWAADISYTDFFGAGRYNLINDRDFLAAELKYYF